MYAQSCLLTAPTRCSIASVRSTGESSPRSSFGAAWAIVSFSRSDCAMAILLPLGEPGDWQHAAPAALRHLAAELVGRGHEPGQRRHERVAALGRQRQVRERTQSIDTLP